MDASPAEHDGAPLPWHDASFGISLLAEPDEAEAEELERNAERYAAAHPDLAADLRRSAERVRHPANGCRPGSRVLTDGGLHRVEADHSLTPLEDPEVARERRELGEQWKQQSERRQRAQERSRRAMEDVLAGRRRTVFAPAARRTPAPRPAARRPQRSSSSSSSSGSDPGDDGDEPPAAPVEPPDAAPRPLLPAPTPSVAPAASPRALAGPSPRFSCPWRPSLDRRLAERLRAIGAVE